MKNHFVRLLTWSCCWAVTVWSLTSSANAQIKTITLEKQSAVCALDISPDGKQFAGVVWLEKENRTEVRVWEIASGKQVGQALIIPENFQSSQINIRPQLQYSNNGEFLVYSFQYANNIYIWSTKNRNLTTIALEKNERIRSLKFHPGTNTLIAHSEISKPGKNEAATDRLKFWSANSGKKTGTIKTPLRDFFSFNNLVVTLTHDNIQFWDVHTQKKIAEKKSGIKYPEIHGFLNEYNLVIQKHGLLLLRGAYEIQRDQDKRTSKGELWDLTDRKLLSSFSFSQTDNLRFSSAGILISEKVILIKSNSLKPTYEIRQYDFMTKKLIDSERIQCDEKPESFGLMKNHVIAGSYLRFLTIWNRKSPKSKLEIEIMNTEKPTLWFPSVASHPDGIVWIIGGAYASEFYSGLLPTPRVFEGQIKIIDLKAFLKKAAADKKQNSKMK